MERHFAGLGILSGIPAAEGDEKPVAKKPTTPLQ
jgi:hypothetical protein